MSNISNPAFALLRPPSEDFLRVARELSQTATRLGIPFFLAGASARDIVLVNLWGQSPGRATVDIDFAFAVDDWTEFEMLRGALLATKRFERVHHKEQRLMYINPEQGFQLPVDFIPFRGVASESETIAWPPDGDFVMNVAGFEETLEAALSIKLEPGLVISVASLPGLAILKILAWGDRHVENNKDAADLYKILTTFDSAGNQDRLFDQEIELLAAVGHDLTLAGAELLGRDAACIADSNASEQITGLLISELLADLLISDMTRTASYEENTSYFIRLFDCFRRGYLEASKSKKGKKKKKTRRKKDDRT
jgi:predicted nucleotidyltransferase